MKCCADSKTQLARYNLPGPAQALIAQSIAALSSAIVRVPTDTIRHRVQAYLHPNWATAVPQLLKSKGVRGFYAGFTPTVIRDVPELVLQFTIYEGLRRVVQRFTGGAKLDTGFHLLLGGTAGAVSAIFSTPLDVRTCSAFTYTCTAQVP
jgi:solute carrier family 25 (mitochondrial S-adenosylmethionine transporter), member 26